MNSDTRKVIMTCIICPVSCQAEVTMQGKQVLDVKGCNCEHGVEYIMKECTDPRRVLTTTVRIRGGVISMLPVRTSAPIPREILRPAVMALQKVEAEAPVKAGQIIVGNLLNTGIDVLASRSVQRNTTDLEKSQHVA